MAIVFNNLSAGGGGSKLYQHVLRSRITVNENSYFLNIPLITNFSDTLTVSNFMEKMKTIYTKNMTIYTEIEEKTSNKQIWFHRIYFNYTSNVAFIYTTVLDLNETISMTTYSKMIGDSNSIMSDTVTEL